METFSRSFIEDKKISKLQENAFHFQCSFSCVDVVESPSQQNASGDSKLPITSTMTVTSPRIPDDSHQQVEVLKNKLREIENRYQRLFYEHERTTIDLVHEKHKVCQLERKLQFLKDSQPIFEKLKQAYINMKYNESTSRKLVEVRDKSCQTWSGIICKACLSTEKVRSDLERFKAKYEGDDIGKIGSALQFLRKYSSEQEKATSLVSLSLSNYLKSHSTIHRPKEETLVTVEDETEEEDECEELFKNKNFNASNTEWYSSSCNIESKYLESFDQ